MPNLLSVSFLLVKLRVRALDFFLHLMYTFIFSSVFVHTRKHPPKSLYPAPWVTCSRFLLQKWGEAQSSSDITGLLSVPEGLSNMGGRGLDNPLLMQGLL